MAGLVVLLISRVGWRRSLPIGAVLFPLVLILFGGRQTSIDIGDTNDTGQGRILLWRDSLMLFRTAPMFGIGVGQLAEANDYVAHNSYIHAFTELGIVGGILFIGTWYVLFVAMPKTIECRESDTSAELIRWKPYVLGMMTTYAAGLFSLTRCYALPTYLVLGCTGAYVRLVSIHVSPNPIRLNGLLCRRLVMAGIGSLVFLYVFVKVFAR